MAKGKRRGRNRKGQFVKGGKSGSASPRRARRRRRNPSAPTGAPVLRANPAPARRRRKAKGKARRRTRRASPRRASAAAAPPRKRRRKKGRRRNPSMSAGDVAVAVLAGAAGVGVGVVGGRLIDAKVPLPQLAKSAIQVGLGTAGAIGGAFLGPAGLAAGIGFGGAMSVPAAVRGFDAIVPLDTTDKTAGALPSGKVAQLQPGVANLAGIQQLRAAVSPFGASPPARLGMAQAY